MVGFIGRAFANDFFVVGTVIELEVDIGDSRGVGKAGFCEAVEADHVDLRGNVGVVDKLEDTIVPVADFDFLARCDRDDDEL